MAITISVTHEGQLSPNTVTDNPQELENCNMLSLEALEESLTYMTMKNYWSLYNIQKKKFGIRRLDVHFSEFIQEFRLQTEKQNKIYSKRYVYYAPIQFIDYRNRKKYKQSEFYNKSVGYKDISGNPDIYEKNFFLLIDGKFIFTAEILPLEDKTAVIIDVASSADVNGIPIEDYRVYRDTNPMVTIIFLPNYKWSNHIGNRYSMVNNKYVINFSKFSQGENIKSNGMMLLNTHDPKKSHISFRRPTINVKFNMPNKRFIFNESILSEFGDNSTSSSTDMISRYDFLVLNFDSSFRRIEVEDNGYFKLEGKMPCPVENMIIFSVSRGQVYFNRSITVDLYYPNIYHINDKDGADSYLVYYFYSEEGISENEEYFNQIALYEEYVNVLGKYMDGSIPNILKEWYPSNYNYGDKDYQTAFSHFHSPTPLVYKVLTMLNAIKDDPWSLKAYLKFLLCPSEKYYIDVTKISLKDRIRTDTSPDPISENTTYIFDKPHYVFAMNRHYLKKSRYDFRIWVDGEFIRNEFYHIELGRDYYYIYIPTDLITNDSVIEIERHKLFNFYTEYTFKNSEDYVELIFDGELVNAYAHDIFIVDMETNLYVNPGSFQISVYSSSLQRWETIDPESFALLNDRKVRIYPKSSSFIGKTLRIGVYKGSDMSTSAPYDKELYHLGDWAYVETTNNGNYKSSDYRVFNNGRLILPVQWQSEWSTTYGGMDSCRTNWVLTKGDQITIDHVPCSFRTVYYQADIPEDGLIDLDGKLNLPINLKWYDIYLNGRRLHYKNLEIVSPTKFYITGVKSRRHLIIFDRDRDNDIFYLPRHDTRYLYEVDQNDTLIDKLIRAGLRDIIRLDKDPIDGSEPDIGNPGVFGPSVLDAIVYFMLYLQYKYINCNYKLLSAEVKRKFKFFISPDGTMGINANIHPSGILYKVINCNKGVGGMDTKLKHEDIDTGLKELSDRFAITPLHSHNYSYALKGEFLCDPETGGTGIRHNDGTITMIDELNRKKEHIDAFEQKLILANIGRYSIFDAQFDDDSRVKVYFRGNNLLDNEIMIERTNGETIGKVAFSIDATVLQKTGNSDILRWSNYDPTIVISYYTQKDHKGLKTYRQVASRLGDRYIEIDTEVLVISSITLELPENAITADVDNPLIENGDAIDVTKGITITKDNYKDPKLPINEGESFTSITGTPEDGEECICPQDEKVTVDISTQNTPVKEPEYNDNELYNPIGPVDASELQDPMRCIVHSILIALRKGDLLL